MPTTRNVPRPALCRSIHGIAAGLLLIAAASSHAQQQPRIETYKRVDQTELKVHIFEPVPAAQDKQPAADLEKLRTAVVMFHGGGWSAGGPEWVHVSARRFASRGLVAVAVQYRLADQRAVTPLDAMEDARDAVRWVRANAKSLGIDVSRVAGYGVSAGGQLAASTASGETEKGGVSSVPNALLLYSPAVSISNSGWMRRLLLGRAKPEAVSPDQLAGTGFPPTLINQGEEDSVTPLSGARSFCARMKQAGVVCEIRTHAGLGHLLSRKLDEQEEEFDVDTVARTDAWRAEEKFLAARGFLDAALVQGADGPEAVVRAHLADFNAKNVDAMVRRVTEDFAWYNVSGGEMKIETQGRDALRKGLESYFKSLPSAKSEIHMLTTNGRFVSARERALWKTSKGEPRSQNALSVYEVEDGLIKRVWYYPAVK